jgi:hypothetical protein
MDAGTLDADADAHVEILLSHGITRKFRYS